MLISIIEMFPIYEQRFFEVIVKSVKHRSFESLLADNSMKQAAYPSESSKAKDSSQKQETVINSDINSF